MAITSPGGWRFDNSYTRLPQQLFVRQSPVPVANPGILLLNHTLAKDLGLDIEWLSSVEGIAMLSGNILATGSEPISQAYAGHQYGHFTMLGDGRAILLGEHITPGREKAKALCLKANPAIIPRNHLVEEAIDAVVTKGDINPVHELLNALSCPYESGRCAERYELQPELSNPGYRTFCGT